MGGPADSSRPLAHPEKLTAVIQLDYKMLSFQDDL